MARQVIDPALKICRCCLSLSLFKTKNPAYFR